MTQSSLKYARWLSNCENLITRVFGVKITRPDKRNANRLVLVYYEKSSKITLPVAKNDQASRKSVSEKLLWALQDLGIHNNLEPSNIKIAMSADEAENARIAAKEKERNDQARKVLVELLYSENFLRIAYGHTASSRRSYGDISYALLQAQNVDHKFAERAEKLTEDQAKKVIEVLLTDTKKMV